MKKPDEIALYQALRSAHQGQPYNCNSSSADAFFQPLGIPEKRGYYLLEKWTDKGWWDYGVNARCGWFTPQAPPGPQVEQP